MKRANLSTMRYRVNVGCGASPIPGWLNFDNSLSVKLASRPLTTKLLRILHLVNSRQLEYVEKAKLSGVKWANAVRHIPLPDNMVEVLYTSHMLEHLDRHEASEFLKEARRVLAPNGIMRIAVPDIRKLVDGYFKNGDADSLIANSGLTTPKPRGLKAKVVAAVVGPRHHHWMYDAISLTKLLAEHGYVDAVTLPAGDTTIPDPGSLNLMERESESLYVEARVKK